MENDRNTTSPALPHEWIARLFSRLRSIYGNRVDSTYGSADSAELTAVWATELGRFDGLDIANALRESMIAYTDFPPTLPQFSALCRDALRRRIRDTGKLAGPREPMPEHIRDQLRKFVEAKGPRALDPEARLERDAIQAEG